MSYHSTTLYSPDVDPDFQHLKSLTLSFLFPNVVEVVRSNSPNRVLQQGKYIFFFRFVPIACWLLVNLTLVVDLCQFCRQVPCVLWASWPIASWQKAHLPCPCKGRRFEQSKLEKLPWCYVFVVRKKPPTNQRPKQSTHPSYTHLAWKWTLLVWGLSVCIFSEWVGIQN